MPPCRPPNRRSLRTRALLSELDLPAAAASLAGLADALPALGAHLHLPAAAAASAASAAPAQASSDLALGLGLGAGGGQEQLRHLLALADAAAVQFGDLADAAAAAAADAAADPDKTDNGWLQPLVSGLEAVLAFIEVRGVQAVVRCSWVGVGGREHRRRPGGGERGGLLCQPPRRPAPAHPPGRPLTCRLTARFTHTGRAQAPERALFIRLVHRRHDRLHQGGHLPPDQNPGAPCC